RESSDWVVNGDKLCAVGEGRLNLHLVDHLGHSFHHIFASKDRGAVAHQVCDATPVPRAFHDLVGDDGDGLGVVQLETAGLPAAGEVGGGDNEQLFDFARGEVPRAARKCG